jgi:NADH:ubiquinone oxidoreductase subunit 4 (subunit M)
MLLLSLLLLPIIAIIIISIEDIYNENSKYAYYNYIINPKFIALIFVIINFFISLFIFIMFDFSSNQFQFVKESHNINEYNLYLGLDGISIYFVLLTTIIMPITLISN